MFDINTCDFFHVVCLIIIFVCYLFFLPFVVNKDFILQRKTKAK